MLIAESNIVTVAQMLHQDLIKQYAPGQKITISEVMDKAKETLEILEYCDCSPQRILFAMESEGLVTRRKQEYTINSEQ